MSEFEPVPDNLSDIEITAGRVPPPHTPAPDWITLSGLSDAAQKLHKVLGMHVNRNRGDRKVWPSTRSLAALMGYSRSDKIGPLLRELSAIGAIEIRKVGMPRRNVYLWHSLPPEGYPGPLTLKDWYRRNKAALDAMREADKARRSAAREKSKARIGEENPQVSPDTPKRGYLADAPKPGVTDTPKRGYLDAPVSGVEQEEEEQEEKNSPLPPGPDDGSDDGTAAGAVEEFEIQDQVTSVVDQVAADRPEWSKRRVVAAVREALADGRDPEIVLAAVKLVAADPETRVPGRLNEEGDWWARAARAVRRPAPKPAAPKWCEEHAVKLASGVECPRCAEEAPKVAPGASEGPGGASEIDPRGLALMPEKVRQRLAGGVRS